MLVLLATASSPEAVVAITFTRKAAGEMLERLMKALHEAASGGEPTESHEIERYRLAFAVLERSRDEGWNLLENPSRLQLVTIDSLCMRLVGRMPLLSNLGVRPTPLFDARPLYREAVRRVLACSGDDSQLGRAVTLAVKRAELRSDNLEKQLESMLDGREQWAAAALYMGSEARAEQLLDSMEQHFASIMGKRLAALDQQLRESLPVRFADEAASVACATRSELESKGNACAWEALQKGRDLCASLESVGAWQGLAALLLTGAGTGTIRKTVDKRGGAPADSGIKGQYVALLDSLSGKIDEDHPFLENLRAINKDVFPSSPEFSRESRDGLLAFFRILLAAHAELWQVFREQGLVDFSEVSVRAIQALGDVGGSSSLLEQLDGRIEHLLVDEFQDTSLIQCRLISRLTEGWQGDGRTMFLVGDPKQAIYRFRKAEVGLFLKALDTRGKALFSHVDLEPLDLSVNFRSEQKIIDWVNTVFAQIMESEHDAERGAVAFSRGEARPKAKEGNSVQLLGWDLPDRCEDNPSSDGDSKEPKLPVSVFQQAEAVGLAALIRDELEPAARERGGKIAILIRARSHGVKLMEELRRNGTRFRALGMDYLSKRSVVRDLDSLAGAIFHRGDRLRGLALLRSPLVGLSLEDLTLLVEADVAGTAEARRAGRQNGEPLSDYRSVTELMADPAALDRVSDDGKSRISRALFVLEKARTLVGRVEPSRVVEAAWIELGGPVLANETEMLDARSFFSLMDEVEQGGHIDLDEFNRRLADQTAAADPDPDIAVEILTMHGAKGLQWDTVVVPGLGREAGSQEKDPIALEINPVTGVLAAVAPQPERGRPSEDDSKYVLLDKREKERGQLEDLRLLYVAATRAEHCLVLSTPSTDYDKEGKRKPPPVSSLLARLWPAVEAQYEERSVSVDAAAGNDVVTGQQLTRLRADFALPAAPPPVADSLRLRRPSETGKPIHAEAMTTDRSALQKGTVVHKWLERIGHDAMEGWDTERLEREKPRIRQALAAEGALHDRLDDLADEAVAALDRALADDKGRWLLGRQEDDRYEWDLTMVAEVSGQSEITSASIDRSFVEDGVRWIVDYKTGRVPFGQGEFAGLDKAAAREKYLAEKKEHYQDQLQAYGELLSQLEPGRSIMLALYFPEVERGLHEWRYEETPRS